MKQYVIDELRPDDFPKLKAYCQANLHRSGIDGIYWLYLDDTMLSPVQCAHRQCGPFYFALELSPERLACELLVRAESRIRCNCIGYASQAQRDWLIQTIDAVFELLEITT